MAKQVLSSIPPLKIPITWESAIPKHFTDPLPEGEKYLYEAVGQTQVQVRWLITTCPTIMHILQEQDVRIKILEEQQIARERNDLIQTGKKTVFWGIVIAVWSPLSRMIYDWLAK